MQAEYTDVNVLALTMIGEARGEGLQGMQAVGNTVINRVALRRWYGITPAEVCKKPWQYSCWNCEDPNRPYLEKLTVNDETMQKVLLVASGLIDGSVADITNGATHYYRQGTAVPAWSVNLTPCCKIGNHLFFKGVP